MFAGHCQERRALPVCVCVCVCLVFESLKPPGEKKSSSSCVAIAV